MDRLTPSSTTGKPFLGIRFRSRVPTVHDDGQPIPEEWHLRCPACEYELTGLTRRVCPECGRIFDPHAIWQGEREKFAARSMQIPAYVLYGVLAFLVLISLPQILKNPRIALPLLILPVYEGAAFFWQKDAGTARGIVMTLCICACVIWWSLP
jgi:hypothetical protein